MSPLVLSLLQNERISNIKSRSLSVLFHIYDVAIQYYSGGGGGGCLFSPILLFVPFWPVSLPMLLQMKIIPPVPSREIRLLRTVDRGWCQIFVENHRI